MTAARRYGDDGFLEAWGRAWSIGEPDAILPFFAPDGWYRDDGSALTFRGHGEIAGFYRFMLRFAPDSLIEFHEAYGNAEGFAARWTWSGTAAGALRVGDELFPAAGVPFSVPGVAYCTLADDGTLASHTDYYDMYAVVRTVRAAG